MSISVQSGVPVDTIIKKFVHSRFEPAGFTENPDILVAKSILDYIGKFLATKFLSKEDQMALGIYTADAKEDVMHADTKLAVEPLKLTTLRQPADEVRTANAKTFSFQDAPACRCGGLMVRTGSCYTCPSCGENVGSCS